MKLTWIAATAIGVSAIMMSGKAAAPIVIWNASPSVPVGFYIVRPSLPGRSQLAVVRLAPGDRGQAYLRRYLHRSNLLLKPVAATEGDRVCRLGAVVLVGQRIRARVRNVDAAGRPLPVWAGCHVLQSGEVFLLAPSGSSFDGRYLGVTRAEQIVGTATRRAACVVRCAEIADIRRLRDLERRPSEDPVRCASETDRRGVEFSGPKHKVATRQPALRGQASRAE